MKKQGVEGMKLREEKAQRWGGRKGERSERKDRERKRVGEREGDKDQWGKLCVREKLAHNRF